MKLKHLSLFRCMFRGTFLCFFVAHFCVVAKTALAAPTCSNGLCDIFRLSVVAAGGTTSASTVTLPGGGSPHIFVPYDAGGRSFECSKTVRVPQPVHDAIVRTLQRMASQNYLARVSEFSPHEKTMLLFFHTVIQQARGLGSCGGS